MTHLLNIFLWKFFVRCLVTLQQFSTIFQPMQQVLPMNPAEKLNLLVTRRSLIMREDFASDTVTQGFRCVVWWNIFLKSNENHFYIAKLISWDLKITSFKTRHLAKNISMRNHCKFRVNQTPPQIFKLTRCGIIAYGLFFDWTQSVTIKRMKRKSNDRQLSRSPKESSFTL